LIPAVARVAPNGGADSASGMGCERNRLTLTVGISSTIGVSPVKKRTLWLGVGFIFLSLWAISTVRGGIWLVLFACFVGLLVVFISKSDLLFRGK
jgi:hypothetical protein